MRLFFSAQLVPALMLVSLGSFQTDTLLNLQLCLYYQLMASLAQLFVHCLFSSHSLGCRLHFTFFYIALLMLCAPLIEIFNNTTSGYVVLYFLALKISILNTSLTYLRQQIFIQVMDQPTKARLPTLWGYVILAVLSGMYALIVGLLDHPSTHDCILILYYLLYALFCLSHLSFLKWLYKCPTVHQTLSMPASTSQVQLLESLFGESFALHLVPHQNEKQLYVLPDYKTLPLLGQMHDDNQRQTEVSRFRLANLCVYLQTTTTIFFFLPYFLKDPMFPTIQFQSEQPNSTLDLTIKLSMLPILPIILYKLSFKYQGISDKVLLSVTLLRLVVISPLHIFLCIHCGDPQNGCTTTKNVVLPLLYFFSFALYFVTVDVPRILAYKNQGRFIKKAHQNVIAKNLIISGTAGMFTGAAGCLIFLDVMPG